MSAQDADATMAVFLDLENIALGAHDAQFPAFDVRKVLERLLLKGHIVVKKAYCDFERYKAFKRGLHEAAFEMIEIPHVRQSGKNSADIRMVVDALDLCYTKSHVDTFAIISGDSDFSPLVSKLRENDKTVIGVGVKQSTSDLFITNCDEFIYYDDLVRTESARRRAGSGTAKKPAAKAAPEQNQGPPIDEALDLLNNTLDALRAERGEDYAVHGSRVKQAIKRQHPGFNERAYGFRTFSDLLLEAQKRGLLKLESDNNAGGYFLHAAE
ncbi:MAG: NYN domain-containing protein [Chthoniobacterales bacterium]